MVSFPNASVEGEYPGMVSVRVCYSDETSPDSSLSEIRIYLTFWLYSDESEVQCRNDGRGIYERGREIPIDQDTARKFFTHTEASQIEQWYNTDVQKWLRRHRGYSDKEGIFILDPTLIAVPDNPNYKERPYYP